MSTGGFTPADFQERRARAMELARSQKLDALLVWGRGGTFDGFSSIQYFSNHTSPMGWLEPLPTVMTACEQAGLLIATDGRGTLAVTEFVSPDVSVEEVVKDWDLIELVTRVVVDLAGSGRLGIVGAELLPYPLADQLRARAPKLELVAADEISSRLRLRLEPREVDVMRDTAITGCRVYQALIDTAQAGSTEGEMVAAGLATAAEIAGCAHWSFLVSSGARAEALVSSSLPAWNAEYRFERGDVVHPDCIGFLDGYCYDVARTFVVGDAASSKQRSVIDGARAATSAMAKALRPGATPRDLYCAACRTLEERDLGAASMHSRAPRTPSQQADPTAFGHAIGAGIFRPYVTPIGPDALRPLEPPLAMALEVFATDSEGNSAFHEDNFLLLDDGVELITSGLDQDTVGPSVASTRGV